MTEYIISIPDECFSDMYRDVYYPDERHEPMQLHEIVRCRDCCHFDSYGNTFGFCLEHDFDCSERRFCAWGYRKECGE